MCRLDHTSFSLGFEGRSPCEVRILNLDLRLSRRFTIREPIALQVTAEAFNLTNRENFASVNNTVGAISGRSISRAGPTGRLPNRSASRRWSVNGGYSLGRGCSFSRAPGRSFASRNVLTLGGLSGRSGYEGYLDEISFTSAR